MPAIPASSTSAPHPCVLHTSTITMLVLESIVTALVIRSSLFPPMKQCLFSTQVLIFLLAAALCCLRGHQFLATSADCGAPGYFAALAALPSSCSSCPSFVPPHRHSHPVPHRPSGRAQACAHWLLPHLLLVLQAFSSPSLSQPVKF